MDRPIDEQRATITDDRGVERPLWRPRLGPRRPVKPESTLKLAVLAIVVLVLTGLQLARKWNASSLGPSDLLLGAVILLVGVLLFAVPAMLLHRRAMAHERCETPLQKATRLMLELGRCPSCDTSLNARTDPDGCRVCPACGGAWKSESCLSGDRGPADPTRCAGCGYSLRDLPLHQDGRLICPECGWSRVVDAAAWNSSPRCWNCKRSLRGLPLALGDRVQCPDCGQWRSGLTEAEVEPEPRA